MEKTIKDKLLKLLGGNADLVAKVEDEVDDVNSRVLDGAIARTAEEDAETETESQDDQETENTPSSIEDAIREMATFTAGLGEKLNELITVNNDTQTQLGQVMDRLSALEADQEEKRKEWVGDLPFRVPMLDVQRPREEHQGTDEGEPERTTKEKVEEVLSAKGLDI